MDFRAEEKLHAFTDQLDSQMFLSPQGSILNQAHFSPNTPGDRRPSFLCCVERNKYIYFLKIGMKQKWSRLVFVRFIAKAKFKRWSQHGNDHINWNSGNIFNCMRYFWNCYRTVILITIIPCHSCTTIPLIFIVMHASVSEVIELNNLKNVLQAEVKVVGSENGERRRLVSWPESIRWRWTRGGRPWANWPWCPCQAHSSTPPLREDRTLWRRQQRRIRTLGWLHRRPSPRRPRRRHQRSLMDSLPVFNR